MSTLGARARREKRMAMETLEKSIGERLERDTLTRSPMGTVLRKHCDGGKVLVTLRAQELAGKVVPTGDKSASLISGEALVQVGADSYTEVEHDVWAFRMTASDTPGSLTLYVHGSEILYVRVFSPISLGTGRRQ